MILSNLAGESRFIALVVACLRRRWFTPMRRFKGQLGVAGESADGLELNAMDEKAVRTGRAIRQKLRSRRDRFVYSSFCPCAGVSKQAGGCSMIS